MTVFFLRRILNNDQQINKTNATSRSQTLPNIDLLGGTCTVATSCIMVAALRVVGVLRCCDTVIYWFCSDRTRHVIGLDLQVQEVRHVSTD